MSESELIRALALLARLCASRPERSAYLSALVEEALAPLGAQAAAIGILDDEGWLEIRTMHGFPTGTLRRGPRFPLVDTLPLTDAVRTEKVITGTYVDIVARYPQLAAYDPRGVHAHYLPLRHRSVVIGGMSVGTDRAVPAALADDFWSSVAALTAVVVVAEEAPPTRARARRHEILTPRQLEILLQLREGRTNAQIARELSYGTSTIAHDIMRIFDALGVKNRREAVDAAERSGLLSPPIS